MRGDWTKPSDYVTGFLQSHGRFGVPFNIVYGPNAPQGIPLPVILTSDEVLNAIKKASNFVGESIPILRKDNTLLGVITEADLFSQYLEVQNKISDIEKD